MARKHDIKSSTFSAWESQGNRGLGCTILAFAEAATQGHGDLGFVFEFGG